jgi:hypothetical protein
VGRAILPAADFQAAPVPKLRTTPAEKPAPPKLGRPRLLLPIPTDGVVIVLHFGQAGLPHRPARNLR